MGSIHEQLIKKVVSKLGQITVANGYSNTIVSVQRLNLDGYRYLTPPQIWLSEGGCTVELGRSVAPSVMRKLELSVFVIATQDPSDSRSGAEILNSLIADVERCVSQNRNWDGLAIDTTPLEYFQTELVQDQDLYLAKGSSMTVQYEHFRHDPYGQA